MIPDPSPYFSPVYIPSLSSLSLSEDERQLIGLLQLRAWRQRALMQLTDAYYRGEQVITNLQIAIPPELALLRTLVGWPRIAVDPLVERMVADGFRLPGATDSDTDLEAVWLANDMDAEQTPLFTDAFAMGRGWILLGSPQESGYPAEMCVESPLNIAAQWDVRSRKPKALLQSYWLNDRRHAALYTPEQTIHVDEDDNGQWQLTDRDVHNFGIVPAVRVANAPRSNFRDGASEITAEVMSITDAACRTLLGLEVAREFYSVPQKIILGATEDDFKGADGTTKSAWQAYITRILALERDDEGNLPEIKQFTPYDPAVFTKLIEMYASQMGGILGAPAQELGIYTQGNPVSADAQQVAESRRDRKARHKQRLFAPALVEAMQIAVRFDNNGVLPDKYQRLAVDWTDPAMFNLAAVSDGLYKQVAAGAIPPTSDVTLKRLGYSVVERAQLEQDRAKDKAEQLLAEVATSVEGKQARAAKGLNVDIGLPADAAQAPPTPTAPPKK
jgi:hypothetical protein